MQSARTSYFALFRSSESRIAVNTYLFSLVCVAKVAQSKEEIQGCLFRGTRQIQVPLRLAEVVGIEYI